MVGCDFRHLLIPPNSPINWGEPESKSPFYRGASACGGSPIVGTGVDLGGSRTFCYRQEDFSNILLAIDHQKGQSLGLLWQKLWNREPKQKPPEDETSIQKKKRQATSSRGKTGVKTKW